MDWDEEQPIATAFRDCRFGIIWELVFDAEIFWGTIAYESDTKTRLLTVRNNNRIEALLLECLPNIPEDIRLQIAGYLHFHF